MRLRILIAAGTMAVLATAARGASPWFQGDSLPRSLADAHESFLAKDYASALVGVKKVFQEYPRDGLLQKNALDLYKSVVLAGGETAKPEGTTLPTEIRRLDVAVGRRRLPDAVDYSLKISGDAVPTHEMVKQLSMTSYTGEVVLDKERGLGEWWADPAPGEESYFELSNFDLRTPPKEGLYYLHAEFDSGSSWDGWIILSGLLSPESPEIVEPSQDQTFVTATPTLIWTDFKSPEYRPSEARSLWVSVAKAEPYDEVFGYWQGNASIDRLTLPADHALPNGRYLAAVAYTEKRPFGEIRLGRSSSTLKRFTVDAQ